MIALIESPEELNAALSGITADVYTEKIRAFAEGYGFGYSFCRFWRQDSGAVICGYYSDAAAVCHAPLTDTQAEELAGFLTRTQFGHILMPYPLYERLGDCPDAEKTLLMKWSDDVKFSVDCDKGRLQTDVSLGQIYEIVRSGFDIDFDKWYTDTSHMLRHGIAGVYMLGNSTCAIRMYSSSGISYVSYVCTLPEQRGTGLAGKLMKLVGITEKQKGNDTFVFCRNELRHFYESAGYSCVGYGADIFIGASPL